MRKIVGVILEDQDSAYVVYLLRIATSSDVVNESNQVVHLVRGRHDWQLEPNAELSFDMMGTPLNFVF